MAMLIEQCPFCDSGHLHIAHKLLSHAVICQSCKSRGPQRRAAEDAVLEWNHTSRLLRRARLTEGAHVYGHLDELEDAVRNLASSLRHGQLSPHKQTSSHRQAAPQKTEQFAEAEL